MPTVCSIKLDATEYRKELQAVISETRAAAGKMENAAQMPPQSKMSAQSDAVRQIKQLKQETEKAAQSTTAFGATAKKSFGELRTSIFSGEKPLQQLKEGLLGLLNPWGMITAAIAAAAAVAAACWDAMTVSASEHLAKMNAVAAASARAREEETARANAAKGWLARLGELSYQEQSNRAAMEETIVLLGALQREYGDLGAAIDPVTRKITNFAEVQKRLQSRMREKQFGSIKAEQDDLKKQMGAQYIVTRGDDIGASEIKARRELGGIDNLSGEARLRFFKKLLAESTTQDDIDGYSKLIELQERSNRLEEEKRRLELTGYSSPEEMTAAARDLTQRDAARWRQNRAFQQREMDDAFAAATDPDEKIQNRRSLISRASEQQEKLQKELEQAQAAENAARESGNQREIDEATHRRLELQEKIQPLQEDIYNWEKQIADVEKERTERNRSFTTGLQRQAESMLPPDRDRMRERAIEEAMQRKGGALSGRERDLVTRLSDITYGRNTAAPPDYGELMIRSNALTARGGFRSGAASHGVEKKIDEWQRQQQRAADEAAQIKDILKELKEGT